ncbi:MAG TPA: FHA domain-containing protein [Ktedonobacteraceae bacterium]|jgi:hypothetical protein|nr:FHA domain-containing protein [Ktedonobacteraceae bacterium]
MPTLRYINRQNQWEEKTFARTIYIGTEPRAETAETESLQLPPDPYMSAEHALVTRSELTLKPVLVDLCGCDTRVNGVPIQQLKVLHHGNAIYLGKTSLFFSEIRIIKLKEDSGHCPLCGDPLLAGEEAIVCPRYPSILHSECWFSTRKCPDAGCEYPNYDVIMDSLGAYPWHIRFERALPFDSPLIQQGLSCSANQVRDFVPFQRNEAVVYCPGKLLHPCNISYHLQCWLEMAKCPNCGYEIREVLTTTFGSRE